MFDFHAMQAMYLALAREDAAPLAAALERLPEIPRECQWAVVPAQPRRAHPRPALGRGAGGGVRPLRPRRGHAPLRPRHPPPPAAHARRRPAAGSGWPTRSCSRCPAPRCSSTARRSGWARTPASRGGWRCARRCSGRTGRRPASRRRRPPTWCGRSRPRRASDRRPSTPPPSGATRARCSTGSSAWCGGGASRTRSGTAPTGTCPPATRRSSRTAATGTAARWSRCTTWPAARRAPSSRSAPGDDLLDLFGDRDVAVDEDGRVVLDLEPHDHRWYAAGRAAGMDVLAVRPGG